MFFEDLSPCMYVASSLAEGEKLKAVGWLAWGHPYTRRQIQWPEARFGKLLRLLEDPWEPFHCMGSHECEFCTDEPLQVSREKYRGSEEPLVTRQVVDGVEIECIQCSIPHLEAYYRRHRIGAMGSSFILEPTISTYPPMVASTWRLR